MQSIQKKRHESGLPYARLLPFLGKQKARLAPGFFFLLI
jgi:hypothetical protein